MMKEDYIVPEILPVRIASEAIVCTSPLGINGERTDYGAPGEEQYL